MRGEIINSGGAESLELAWHARTAPDRTACFVADTGQSITYLELDADANRLGHLLHERGLAAGDHIAIVMDNDVRFFEIVWAAHRFGLYYTAVSTRLTAPEAAYIIEDCGAKIVIVSAKLGDLAAELAPLLASVQHRLVISGEVEGWERYEDAVSPHSSERLSSDVEGIDMLYSSGTTGRPKGVKIDLALAPAAVHGNLALIRQLWGFDEQTVFLSPAPLYHAAPLRTSMAVHRLGGTVVVLAHFDAEQALAAIERYRVTHSQWVPTMFVRILRLPPEVRARYDVSSLRVAIHAAASCPIPVKERMLELWGPILYECYGGTEGIAFVHISPQEWLEHRGSVGRTLSGEIHIVGDDGAELPPHVPGLVCFETDRRFEYHNDPAKTADAYDERGWASLGDIGYLDAEGYLYLTDRKDFVIVVGGVNVYPQEAENVLVTHPSVLDAAVFGVPDDEYGEAVKAVVQLAERAIPQTGQLEKELIDYCRTRLSTIKCPRSIEFVTDLPRHPNGKLYKRLLKAPYWAGRDSEIG